MLVFIVVPLILVVMMDVVCLGAVFRSPLIPVVVMDLFIFRCRSLVTIDPGRRPGFDRHSRCPVAHCCCCSRQICCILSNFALFMIDKSAVLFTQSQYVLFAECYLRYSSLFFFAPRWTGRSRWGLSLDCKVGFTFLLCLKCKKHKTTIIVINYYLSIIEGLNLT